ncbi:conserved hypothetical protein, partial [Ricinus communis]
ASPRRAGLRSVASAATTVPRRSVTTLAFAALSSTAAGADHAAAPDSYDLVMTCYLIKHGNDWVLWDAGLPKKYLPGPVVEGTFTTALDRTIADQLRDIGLRPEDITYVAVSHAHFDHAGQVNDFPNAT